ncbi:SIMPL domain-containing protein [Pseudochryseolinea flava]|uniref:SIMPL domain-containing protein n=1 Tax=Pseudochryseolinea flava TaxID=2059302 RepID=A0A364Y172_9BACT|nr:SIMPL domain-containing protein [Pseudochryseolinea flava]RAV99513.1 hypothetical protein DQQ10_18075 [Pseudochryseolinea flava]
MIRTLTLCALLIVSFTEAFSQKFITVNVSDSIILKPTKIVYRILVGDFPRDPVAMYTGEITEASPSFYLDRAKELAKFLTKNNINFRDDQANDFVIGSPNNRPTFYIDLKTQTELEEVVNLLKDTKNIFGAIFKVTYEDEAAYTNALMTKILKRAHSDADQIAKIAGAKLGPVLEIEESGGFDRAFFERDYPASLYESELYHKTADNLTYTCYRAFSIKYQILE